MVKEIRNAIMEASDYSVELANISIERILKEAEGQKIIAERENLEKNVEKSV